MVATPLPEPIISALEKNVLRGIQEYERRRSQQRGLSSVPLVGSLINWVTGASAAAASTASLSQTAALKTWETFDVGAGDFALVSRARVFVSSN